MNCFKNPRILFAFVVLHCASQFCVSQELERLTDDGRMKFTPIFIKNGEELMYVDFEDPRVFRLKTMQWDNKSIKPVHDPVSAPEFDPAYSKDGKCFCFLRAVGGLQVALFVRNTQDNSEFKIDPLPGFSGYRSPAVAPDSSLVLYSFAQNGAQDIYAMEPDGSNRRAITGGKGINIWPSFSPDGSNVVFTSTRDGNYELYSMKPDGADITRLTDSPFQDIRATYSPDGSQLVFTSHRDGNAEIYIANADGTNPVRITNHEERDDYATWHPDGKSIVFVAERDGKHDLYQIAVPSR